MKRIGYICTLFTCIILFLLFCVEKPTQDLPQSNHYKDSLIVRHLLDLNGFTNVEVYDVSTPDTGRIESITIQFDSFDTIPPDIIQLSKLSFLHLSYGNLRVLPDSIGYLSSLSYLNVSNNKISTLPKSIVLLKLPDLGPSVVPYTGLSIGHNQICNASNDIKEWLGTYDPDWQETQKCQ